MRGLGLHALGLNVAAVSGGGGGGGWTPSSASGVTIKGWWENDASKVYHDLGTTLATNGQLVQQISDKSGTSTHLTDNGNGSSLEPTWNTTGNGYFGFDGGDTLLTPTSKNWGDGSGQMSFGWAGSIASTASTNGLLSIGSSMFDLRMLSGGAVPEAVSFDNASSATNGFGPATSAGANARIIVTVSSTTLTVYTNGVAGTPVSLSGTRKTPTEQFYFGSNIGSDRLTSGSKMVAAVAYAGVLGSSDITALDTYLAARF